MSPWLVAVLLTSSLQVVFSASCPPLTSNTTSISCFSGDEKVNCSQPQSTGSWAEVVCKLGYTTSTEVTYLRINCTDSGQWDRPVFECHPDCGRRNTNQGQPLIYGGTDARVGEFPWHVGIYDTQDDKHRFRCGGSLISTNIVITGASCFWTGLNRRQTTSVYEVAAGKYKQDWLDTEDGDRVQRRLVDLITIHPSYLGLPTNYQADIALVRLSSPMVITASVNLVCVDWGNLWEEAQLTNGNKGTVPGWGFTEHGSLSSVLKHVELPYVDHATCLSALDLTLKPFLTLDAFCAGYVNRSVSVCRGDSGGGLVFLHESSNRYYLQGLVSIAFKPADSTDLCYAQWYTRFTAVSFYHRWMRSQGV